MSTESSDPMEWVDLTYEEALQHILWIQDPEVEDDMQIYFIGLVDSTFPGADVDDLIFWPNVWFRDEEWEEAVMSNKEIVQYLMAWTGKTLVGAEGIELPDIPDSKRNDVPPAIRL